MSELQQLQNETQTHSTALLHIIYSFGDHSAGVRAQDQTMGKFNLAAAGVGPVKTPYQLAFV